MAKRGRTWTNSKYERYLKEGRGTGEGKEYKPWLRIQDFPSNGRATRVLGNKTNRIHHLFLTYGQFIGILLNKFHNNYFFELL